MRRGLSLGLVALVAAVAAVFLGVLPAFGHTSAEPTGTCPGGDTQVTIADFSFTPSDVTINQGDIVCWTNNGSFTHTATDDQGRWDTGDIAPGGISEIQFDVAGDL